MSAENHKAYAIKQKEIDYNERDLLMVQAQLLNRNSEGHISVSYTHLTLPTILLV